MSEVCTLVRDLIPELAAGSVAGHERAFALRHVAGCDACRRELAETSELADELLTLAAGHEPPDGFEAAVLARMSPPRRRLPVGRAAVAALALAASACGAGLVWWGTADERTLAASHRDTLRTAHGRAFAAAPLMTAGGTRVATLFAYEGDPSWIYLAFVRQPPAGTYQVRLTLRDGRSTELRTLQTMPAMFGWGSRAVFKRRELGLVEFRMAGVVVMSAGFDQA